MLAVCLLMSACIQPVGNMLHAQEINEETQGEVDSASGKIKSRKWFYGSISKRRKFYTSVKQGWLWFKRSQFH